jgi:succinate dehydrogenase/fumarate reductase flavoprotein subunit
LLPKKMGKAQVQRQACDCQQAEIRVVVGTGLARLSAAASLAELGYSVKAFTYRFARRAPFRTAQSSITTKLQNGSFLPSVPTAP